VSIHKDIQSSFASAQKAQTAYCEALSQFDVACALGTDEEAEHARAKVLACCESFMDHHAVAYRRMRNAGEKHE
jgi:hypothetical protein